MTRGAGPNSGGQIQIDLKVHSLYVLLVNLEFHILVKSMQPNLDLSRLAHTDEEAFHLE